MTRPDLPEVAACPIALDHWGAGQEERGSSAAGVERMLGSVVVGELR